MAYKQEPCPLCGRDMTAIETYPGRGELYCGHCDLTIGGNDAKTPEELIALMDSSEHRRLKAENDKLRQLVETLRDYIAGYTEPCDFCAMQGTCENHPAPPPCKYELDVENAPVLGWIDDILSELGIEVK